MRNREFFFIWPNSNIGLSYTALLKAIGLKNLHSYDVVKRHVKAKAIMGIWPFKSRGLILRDSNN